MVSPAIDVLGAYRVPFTEALLREAMELKYGHINPEEREELSRAEAALKEELSSIALIEVAVQNPDDRFAVGDFGQPHMDQVAYDEAYLSSDGTRVLSRGDPPPGNELRIGVFIHFYDPSQPVESSYGPLACPPLAEMPARLASLMPYEPVD